MPAQIDESDTWIDISSIVIMPRRLVYPTWFKWETGFKFYDGDGDLCVLLGTADHCEHKNCGVVNFKGDAAALVDISWTYGLLVARCYKGTFDFCELNLMTQEDWNNLKPCDDQGLFNTNQQKYRDSYTWETITPTE